MMRIAPRQLASTRAARYGRWPWPRQRWRLVIHGGAGSMRPRTARCRSRSDARAPGSRRRSTPASAILDSGEARARRGRGRGARARGRSLLQRRPRRVLHRRGLHRARRRDHGRARPPRRRGRRAARRRAPDQPRPAADGARPARLPVRRGRRRVRARARLRAGRRTAGSRSPSAAASSTSCSPRAAFDDEIKYGTVGAVAVDVDGHVAAATSTGGLTAKRWGRVGDSPLIGAGTYADDRSAAVSATGSGEYFIRAVAAHQLAERVRLGGERCRRRSMRCSPTSRRSAARAG